MVFTLLRSFSEVWFVCHSEQGIQKQPEFASLETRRKVGRVNFRKDFGTVTRDGDKNIGP